MKELGRYWISIDLSRVTSKSTDKIGSTRISGIEIISSWELHKKTDFIKFKNIIFFLLENQISQHF